MLTRFDEIKGLFGELQSAMKTGANIYVIGGGVLLMRGMKATTQDIDIVVDNKSEFEAINKALRAMGFKAKKLSALYEHFDLAFQLIRDDFQVDLFHRKVCSQFSLSKKMIERAEKILALGKVNVFLCSNEDVFLFKTMTERPGDLEDCTELIKKGLDWNAVLAEMKYQIENYGRDVWVTWIGERLDLLEDRGLNIPIMKEINILREKYFDDLEKRQARK
jgi:hypothetical protein